MLANDLDVRYCEMLGCLNRRNYLRAIHEKNDLDEIYQGRLALLLRLFKFFDFSA
jgi:hypothetical protein